MITLKQFMETVDYRITEGSDYQWQCFGSDAYCLDSWNGEQDGHTISIIFDTRDQTVYQVMAYDYNLGRAYRMTNPDFKEAFDAECENRDVLDMAWEDDAGEPIKYVDLEVEEDFLEKAQAIVEGTDYDTRVRIPVEFSDEELLTYMKMAHDRDMTFNQFVEEAIKSAIENHQFRELKAEFDTLMIEEEVKESKKDKKKKGKK
jgi:hypothetical protein